MDKEKVKDVADQVFGDMAGAMTAGLCYVCTTTGLFAAMAGKGPLNLDGVVHDAGFTHFEWLDIKSQTFLFYAARP